MFHFVGVNIAQAPIEQFVALCSSNWIYILVVVAFLICSLCVCVFTGVCIIMCFLWCDARGCLFTK